MHVAIQADDGAKLLCYGTLHHVTPALSQVSNLRYAIYAAARAAYDTLGSHAAHEIGYALQCDLNVGSRYGVAHAHVAVSARAEGVARHASNMLFLQQALREFLRRETGRTYAWEAVKGSVRRHAVKPNIIQAVDDEGAPLSCTR